MADADEDHISAHPAAEDDDPSDELPDYGFLASHTPTEDPLLPRRGAKDFEPNPTQHQTTLLAQSRAAMHNALSHTRTHIPKSHLVGYWEPSMRRCRVPSPKGQHFRTMGRAGRDGTWLSGEEMLYLLERGSLDVRWPVFGEEEEGEGEGVVMGLQGGYAAVIGEEGVDGRVGLEEWVVYSGLRRAGFAVFRAGDIYSEDAKVGAVNVRGGRVGIVGLFSQIFGGLFGWGEREAPREGPLVGKGVYRSYNEIYKRLAITPWHDPNRPSIESPTPPEAPFKTTYHIWKLSSTTFRKSNPGPPDFRVAVVNARTTSVPTLEQMSALLESMPFDPPTEKMEKHMYQKLKHGYRNVILAIVDQGVVSYLRVSDAGFGNVKLYERFSGNVVHGGKGGRGGRGGTGGRGGRGGRGRGKS